MKSVFQKCVGFEWDQGNINKNWEKHSVSETECEEPFFNEPIVVTSDSTHSTDERRYFLLGTTNAGREIMIVFTIRDDKVSVISARDMSRKERKIFHGTT